MVQGLSADPRAVGHQRHHELVGITPRPLDCIRGFATFGDAGVETLRTNNVPSEASLNAAARTEPSQIRPLAGHLAESL